MTTTTGMLEILLDRIDDAYQHVQDAQDDVSDLEELMRNGGHADPEEHESAIAELNKARGAYAQLCSVEENIRDLIEPHMEPVRFKVVRNINGGTTVVRA